MLPRRNVNLSDYYPWPHDDISKRGVTAPKPQKIDPIFVPNRIPTSSSKYANPRMPNLKVSIKGSGWKSYNPREPVRSVGSYQQSIVYNQPNPQLLPLNSPSPEQFEHIWEEGGKRPKTQNEKSRKKPGLQTMNFDTFPARLNTEKLYEVPIIVVRDDKNKRIASAKRNGSSVASKRPATFKPGKSSLVSTLDQDFLDLFEV